MNAFKILIFQFLHVTIFKNAFILLERNLQLENGKKSANDFFHNEKSHKSTSFRKLEKITFFEAKYIFRKKHY